MKLIALLRGVTPIGKNRIPSMAYCAEVLKLAGFHNVKTYIQSGNICLETDLPHQETAIKIHDTILSQVGADLSVILKTQEELDTAVRETPFDSSCDSSRIHLVFTNSTYDPAAVRRLEETGFYGELFRPGTECFYLYLPRSAQKKTLNTNYLEKKLGITATMRKLSVIRHLCSM